MLSASRKGSPERRSGTGYRTCFHFRSFHPHKHLRRRADQLLIAQLQNEFVGAGARFLNAPEKLGRIAIEGRAKRLPQNHLVVVADAHSLAHRLHLRHVFFRLMIGHNVRLPVRSRRSLDARRGALQPGGTARFAGEIELKALNRFLLAIDEIDVVAQKQMQIFVPVARQTQRNGIKLQQQVVAKRTY